jgi:hypothetical protein
MADSQSPTVQQHNVWAQLLGGLLAAVAPVVVRAVLDALGELQRKLGPWDGTDRRGGAAAPPPSAGGTP